MNMKHMSNVSMRVLCMRLHCSSLALFNIKLSHPCASAPTRGEACSRVSTVLSYYNQSKIETSAQKYKNLRIGVFYPLSFPDFGHSAGLSIFRPLQRGRKNPPCTVVL